MHEIAEKAQSLTKIKGKIFAKERYKEKVKMRKTIKAHEQKEATVKDEKEKADGAVPAYLLDRNEVNRTKVLSNMIKQKRKEKAGKWKVPIEKVKPMTEDEMFKIMRNFDRVDKSTFYYNLQRQS